MYNHFSNKLIYLCVYVLVICILSCEVAIAADAIEEPQPSSPIGEGQSFTRISQSGASRFGANALLYKAVSYVWEWFEGQQLELGDLKEELTNVTQCHTAKRKLEHITFKYYNEQLLINKANYILKDGNNIIQSTSLDAGTVSEHKKKIDDVTIELNAQYKTYTKYKDKTTDYLLLWVLNITNCCCLAHKRILKRISTQRSISGIRAYS